MSRNAEYESHPSYGMVGFNRVQGNPGRLYGDPLPGHATFVTLTVKRGSVRRDLGTDWHAGGEQILEINLSGEQFARLLTSMNVGDGVPCTIAWEAGKGRIERPPVQQSAPHRATDEAKEKIRGLLHKVKAKASEVEAALAEKKVPASTRKEVGEVFLYLIRELGPNLQFAERVVEEQFQRAVTSSIAEINSAVTAVVEQTGIRELRRLSSAFSAGGELSLLGDGSAKEPK